MSNLWVEETHINEDDNALLGEPYAYETFTDDKGELFRSVQREYGRCTSKMYIDTGDGETLTIGWVFSKQTPYEDAPNETYQHTVWVAVLNQGPEVQTTRTYDYAEIGG